MQVRPAIWKNFALIPIDGTKVAVYVRRDRTELNSDDLSANWELDYELEFIGNVLAMAIEVTKKSQIDLSHVI